MKITIFIAIVHPYLCKFSRKRGKFRDHLSEFCVCLNLMCLISPDLVLPRFILILVYLKRKRVNKQACFYIYGDINLTKIWILFRFNL